MAKVFSRSLMLANFVKVPYIVAKVQKCRRKGPVPKHDNDDGLYTYLYDTRMHRGKK